MRKLITLLIALPLSLALAAPVYAQTEKKPATKKPAKASAPAERTYYGEISDSMCGATHKMKGSPQECTKTCVKGGAKYVFVARGKVLEISNQDFADLEKLAGEHVRLTGTKSADGKSLTVSKLAQVTSRKKAAKKT